jgi:hypothetical protein
MATRKMTFSIPVDLASQLVKRVPARDRSRFLAKALEKSLREEEQALVRSCRLANQDPEVTVIEQEWDQIGDPIEEPWSESPPR